MKVGRGKGKIKIPCPTAVANYAIWKKWIGMTIRVLEDLFFISF